MKQVLYFIIIVLVTGCKVTQVPSIKQGTELEPSAEMAPEEMLHTENDKNTDLFDTITSLPDSTFSEAAITLPDSLTSDSLVLISSDSLNTTVNGIKDSIDILTDSIPKKKGTLEAIVDYQAKDSIVWTAGNIAHLYGEGDVKYQNIKLTSEVIQMKMDSSLLYATHGIDTLGEEFGFPVFSENDQNIEAKEMLYNFKTRKASATHVATKQGEGLVIANITKKMENDVMNMKDGKYTTCDHEHPHFYINMTKAKVRPGKDIVAGPLYLVVEDVPLFPLVLPFAFFPFTDTYSSGIIMPSYGEEMERGFFLRNGGYYFALSDYFDLALTGELYTKGSWGLAAQTSYKKRYKYSGNINLSYLITKRGEKGIDYSESKSFQVRVSHRQDPKANPYRTVSANLDYSTNNYYQNQLNTLYTPDATNNNKGSSVSITQRFPNKPFSISATMNINQRSQDSSVSVTLPNLTLSLSRIYPFKRKNATGKERWYEKISLDYSGDLRNRIDTKEDQLFKSNLIKDWNNGMSHSTNIQATYTLLDYINISPSLNYQEKWLTRKVNKEYDSDNNSLTPVDTTYGFYRLYNYSASVSLSTTLYGMFTPIKPLQKWIRKIRHRIDPSISFSSSPDFGDPAYGYYHYYDVVNQPSVIGADPSYTSGYYSPFEGQIFSPPGRGESGSIRFALDNNIEAKIASARDSTGEKKISLIDKLSASISYNLAADSFQWSDWGTSLRIKLSKAYTLNLNATFETYAYGYNETTKTPYRINKPRWEIGKGLGRLKSTGSSFSYTVNNQTFKNLFGGGGDNKSKASGTEDRAEQEEYDPDDPFGQNEDEDMLSERESKQSESLLGKRKKTNSGEYDEDGYYNNTLPWSFSFNYGLRLSYGDFNVDKLEYDYKLSHALSFNGNIQPTKNWRISFNATYDFDNNRLSYMTCNISRQMHCFQMSASIIPIGPLKSYSFSISANSSLLQDLKYDQSSTPYNGQTWY